MAVLCTSGALSARPSVVSAQASTPTAMLAGRLATVETRARRIALIPDGEVQLAAVSIAEDSDLRHGDEPLTLSELVLHVGRRVMVQYRDEGGQRVASRVTVVPEE